MELAIAAILIFAGASFFFALRKRRSFPSANGRCGNWREHHPVAGKIVARLLERPQDLLATLALGNTFANAAMLAVALRMVFDAHWALALTLIALLALTLIVCEVFPKTLAVRRPERWALRVGWLLLVFSKNLHAGISRGATAEFGFPEKIRAANGHARAGAFGCGISRAARHGPSAGHARRIREGNHPADHRPRPAHGARRDAPARRHGVHFGTTQRWRK